MRVLHVLPHQGGGAETYIDMLEGLGGLEHERCYLSSGRRTGDATRSLPARWPRLAKRVGDAGLLHCHGDAAGVIALPLLHRRPAVMTTHGLHLMRRLRGPARALMRGAMRGVISSCQAVICLSQAEAEDLAALAGEHGRAKLILVHNGVGAPPALGQSERVRIRREIGAPNGIVLALFVGQLEERKAPLLAVRAALAAERRGTPLVLAIAGEGPQAEEIRRLGGETVRMLGHRDDVPLLMGAADVFVHPSEREGMSFALLEAMSQGLAIVASDSSSNPEAVGDGGLLVAGGDEQGLANALHRLGKDSDLRAQLGARARQRASSEFGLERFRAETEAVYRRALGLTEPDRGAGERSA